jgi:hypothetical protein
MQIERRLPREESTRADSGRCSLRTSLERTSPLEPRPRDVLELTRNGFLGGGSVSVSRWLPLLGLALRALARLLGTQYDADVQQWRTRLRHKQGYAVLILTILLLSAASCSDATRNPVAQFLVSVTSGPSPLDVAFDASASYAPGGTIVDYSWTFGDGAQGHGATCQHVRSVG